jgi:hypothetical protein
LLQQSDSQGSNGRRCLVQSDGGEVKSLPGLDPAHIGKLLLHVSLLVLGLGQLLVLVRDAPYNTGMLLHQGLAVLSQLDNFCLKSLESLLGLANRNVQWGTSQLLLLMRGKLALDLFDDVVLRSEQRL